MNYFQKIKKFNPNYLGSIKRIGIFSLRSYGFGATPDFDPSKDYYKILGVKDSATPKEIKAAYYKLAQTMHPDKNYGVNTDKFKEITNAYNILSDKTKKQQYDSFRKYAGYGPRSHSNAQTNQDESNQGYYKQSGYNNSGQNPYEEFQEFFKNRNQWNQQNRANKKGGQGYRRTDYNQQDFSDGFSNFREDYDKFRDSFSEYSKKFKESPYYKYTYSFDVSKGNIINKVFYAYCIIMFIRILLHHNKKTAYPPIEPPQQ